MNLGAVLICQLYKLRFLHFNESHSFFGLKNYLSIHFMELLHHWISYRIRLECFPLECLHLGKILTSWLHGLGWTAGVHHPLFSGSVGSMRMNLRLSSTASRWAASFWCRWPRTLRRPLKINTKGHESTAMFSTCQPQIFPCKVFKTDHINYRILPNLSPGASFKLKFNSTI